MDTIINAIVSNYLADYLEINPEKTKTSILSGTVELSGVKFKKNLFTTLNLPYLELEDGFIGKIQIELSLPRFYLYPIVVKVDQIFIKVRPRNVNKILEKEILETYQKYKQKKLNEFEELMNIKFSSLFQDDKKSKDNKSDSFSYIESIINNLHIDIKKIVIIYDDCVSSPKYPYSFGISLNQLYIDSTSKDFKEIKEEDKSSPLKYKKLSIINFNLFLDKINKDDITIDEKNGDISANHKILKEKLKLLTDKEKDYLKDSLNFYLYCESEIDNYSKDEKYHHYLLRNLNFDIKVIINQKFELNKEPKISVILETSSILTQLSNRQIKAITSNLNYISLKDFYQQTTIDNYFKSKEKIDNDTIKKYLENYSLYYKTKYIEIYKNDKENKQYLKNMEEIEKNLKLENIKALREMGNDIINNFIEIGKIDKEIKEKASSWSNYWSSKNTKDIEKLKIERELKIKEQKKIQEKNSTLNQFKDYVEGIFKNSDDNKKNKIEDRVQFYFKFIMKELILKIKEEKINEIKEVFDIKFDLLQCQAIIKTVTQFINLSLKDMELKQYLSNNKDYQKILFSKNKQDNLNVLSDIIKNDKEINLLSIEFENNYLLPISPFKLKFHLGKQIYIILDYYYIYYLYNLFLKNIIAIDFNNLSSMVNEKILKIVQTGYNNLLQNKEKKEEDINNNEKLFNIHVDILLNAPILLLPLYFRDENNAELMYVSLGQLKINSELAGEKDKNAIYDKYNVEFSNICIKTFEKYNIRENKDEEGDKLLYPSSFNINIENYIYQKPKLEHKLKEDFSPLLVNLVLNNTKFSLNEEQILFMIKYLENFQRTQYEFEKEEKEKDKEKIELKKEIEENNKKEKNDDKNQEIDNKIKEEKKDEKKEENKKINEITNVIKISFKLGIVQMFLLKNINNEQNKKTIKFMSFFFRESIVNCLIKSNGSMNMDISFGHFYLYDTDYNVDEQQKPIYYINQEFKCIVGTTAFGIKDKKNNKIKFSEIYDFINEPNSKESLKVIFSLDAEKNITIINITMSKLTISPNLSTLTRLYLFLNKYLELFNDSMDKIKNDRLRDKILEEINSNNIKDSYAPLPSNLKQDENIKKKQKKKEEEAKINEKIMKNKDHSILNILFSMKGIDIYIPVNPNSHNTSIIFMSIEIPIKFNMETDVETEFSLSEIVKINYNKKSNKLIADLNKGSFSIYEYKEDFILLDSINQIYEDIDFSFMMSNSLNINKKRNEFHIIAQMNKGIYISINISHIIVFLEILDAINNFLKGLEKEEVNVQVKKEDKLFTIDDEDIKRARSEELIKIKENKKEKEKIKNNEIQKTNINNFVDIFTYEFKTEDISIKFYDIIDGVYQSLFEFYIKDSKLEMYQNSNPKDSTNLMNYLINSFKGERKELNTYDKNNFYLYFNALTNIEVKSLNNYINQWEYFIEPFSMKFYYCQLLKRMRPNIELLIPNNMLNINLSLNFARILEFVLKKFSINKEEIGKKKEGKLYKDEIVPKSLNYSGIESPILILENYTGVDMEIWFDNIKYDNKNNDKIITLRNNKKYELTNSLLKKYNIERKNNNLNSTISYKFCLDKNLMNNAKINENNIMGKYFNINYHHIDIHEINELVKVSIESSSDNLLCRHISFNSLISITNDTKFKDIQLCNNVDTQKVDLNDNKRHSVPISWCLYNKNINLLYNNDSHILIKNLSQINDITKYIQFNNKEIIIIDVLRYKFNLEEYYSNKNLTEKKDIFRIDIILSPPIHLINNTPYEYIVNNDNKILSTKSLNVYNNNLQLLSEYVKIMNEKGKKKKNNEKQIILKIIKDIKMQIKYENKLLTASSFVEEKSENDEEDKNEEGNTINNFSTYNKNLSIVLKDNNTKTYLICRLFFNNPYDFLTYNNKIYSMMKAELNSFKYEIVFDCYFVNRTNHKLFLNNKVIEGINSKNDNCLIEENKYTPISKTLLNKKIKLRGDNNYWSDNFEISALGEEFTLNIKKNDKIYNSLGMKITISNLFKKSISLIIEDKYIVINDLPFDIKILEDKSKKVIKIKKNENKILLLNEESLSKKDNYRIGIKNCYSHKFDLDKLGFYDLLISYNKKVYEEENIDIENKLVELNNSKFYPVRCVINTINKNTIYILFSYNKEYINQLRNHTHSNIEIILNKDKKSKYIVKPEQIIPLIYFNDKEKYEPCETIKIIFNDKTSEMVALNEIATKISGNKKNYVIKIQPDNNNSIKCIKLFNKNDPRLKKDSDLKNKMKKYTKVTGANIKLHLYGIGFSIINESPKEIFYLSFYDIYLCYKNSYTTNIINDLDIYNSFLFSLKNLQLDYCLDNSYDIVFNPTNQLLPPKLDEKEKKDKNFIDKVFEDEENNTPFIQFVMSQKVRQSKNREEDKLIYSIYPEIAIFVQEFDIRINTILINSLIKLINEYMQIFLPPEEDKKNLKEIKDQNNENVNEINDENLIVDNKNDEFINKLKDKLLNKEGKNANLVINNLTLSAIKLNATFKINKNVIEIRYVPEIFTTLISTLCSSFSSFSDATLKLNEIIFLNVFSDIDSLTGKLITYYKNQILAQIYKIILNIDLFGNPINLLEGVGTGIFQLFNEPRKGLLKGPEEFGLGITRGARALVSNVVGGGFNSVSKITGTLLNASKNISSIGTKEEPVIKEEEKPKGFFSGTVSGFKKGFGELTQGVAGIVTKPIEQTKKGGVGGFFKGLGSGLVGAVLAPVNTVLTVGTEVTSGISNSEFISNKKIIRRFRLPRTLYKYLPISPYDEKKEMERKKQRDKIKGSKQIIISLSNELLYLENSTEIVMCGKLANSTNIIFTNVMIKILNSDLSQFIKKIYVCDIKEKIENNNNIELVMKDESKNLLQFRDEKSKKSFIDGINKYLN